MSEVTTSLETAVLNDDRSQPSKRKVVVQNACLWIFQCYVKSRQTTIPTAWLRRFISRHQLESNGISVKTVIFANVHSKSVVLL